MLEIYHVVPIDDIKPHVESGTHCPCQPEIRPEPPYGQLVIHNAWDGREFYEESGPKGH